MVELIESNSRKTDTFRVGVFENIVNSRYGPDPLLRAGHLAAVAAGVDSFWVPDHLNSLLPRSICTQKYMGAARLAPSPDAYLEPWTMLGYLAAHNRLGRLRLGVCVTDTARRNPAVTAQAAATLQLLTRGRAILGIGTGEREGNEPYGVDWSKPVARFEEALATIRALWGSEGEPVNRDSAYFPLRNAVFDLPPYKRRWPQIWIAAHRPRVLHEQTVLAYTAKVPRSLLTEMYLTGTAEQVIQQVAEWRAHGLRYIIVANSSGLQRSLRKGMASSMPFAKIMRGLKKL